MRPPRNWRAGLPSRLIVRRLAMGVAAGCAIQHTGWPCGSCFLAGLAPHPQAVEMWRAILAFRGDYEDHRTPEGYRLAVDLIYRDPPPHEHVFRVYPFAEVHALIQTFVTLVTKETRP